MLASRFAISTGRPEPLGVTVEADGINLAVVSRHAEVIWACIYDEDDDREIARLPLPGRSSEVHHGFISGVVPGMRYGLRADGPYNPVQGHWFDPAKLLVDPYAVAVDRHFAWHPDLAAPRSAARDTSALVPKAVVARPLPLLPLRSSGSPGFIYEIAVKAFSQRHPDIPLRLRGKAAALAHPCAIEHLLRLGVDTVELMPLAAWIDERHLPALGLSNGWGYNPVTFMAPDPRLAPGGLAEIRAAVQALQAAGIRVLLDIVLNHTGESDAHGATLSLRGLDNALYYRHAEDDPGRLVNDTGCGNTMALDREPVIRLALDTLRHWRSQTGVDGFRFDLATVLGRMAEGFRAGAPLLAAIEKDAALAGLAYVAEPWDVGPGGYRLGQFPAGWHEWNDRYRDDVRRFWRGADGSAGALATRLAGSSDVFAARSPAKSVNFIAAHDGFTLRDAVSYGSKHNLENGEDNRDGSSHEISWNNGAEGETADAAINAERQRDQRALLATLMLSRGTPMLTAGDEFGRTQRGNNNAYAQDNEITWLDWTNADQGLINFVASLSAFRRAHPAVSADRFLTGAPVDDSGIPDAEWLTADGLRMADSDWADAGLAVLGLALYEPSRDGRPADRLCLWFNRSAGDAAVAMPQSRPGFVWSRMLDSSGTGAGNHPILPGRSVVAFGEVIDAQTRSRKADDATVERLAAMAGIQPEWWQVDGTHHQVSIETKRALLRAMRLPAETLSDAADSLQALQRAKDEAPERIAAPPTSYLHPRIADGERLFGLATHLYALRHAQDSGIGDFETLAQFGATATTLGGAFAGINPLHHLFPTDRERASPYQPSDRRFIDPIYISIEGVEALLLPPRMRTLLMSKAAEIAALREHRYVNYQGVWALKRKLLSAAFVDFCDGAGGSAAPQLRREFEAFTRDGGDALRRHGQYEAAKASSDSSPAEFHIWLQWLAERQFADAAVRARKTGLDLGIYRDLALGVARDGGEIWANPTVYADGVSLGAPPDPFARDGQVWQLAPFEPHALRAAAYEPFIAILRANMRHAGLLRIDHILGYMRQFWVPDGAAGKDGAYVDFPLEDLLAITASESHRARCTIIGEDLGTVPPGLRERLAESKILSYRVLWWERDGARFLPPERYPPLSVSCLSSHDLPTFAGWRQGRDAARLRDEAALRQALQEQSLSVDNGDDGLMIAAHELLARSRSALVQVQVDDLLGETEPLNVPGTDKERPNWRRRLGAPIGALADHRLAEQVVAAVERGRTDGK